MLWKSLWQVLEFIPSRYEVQTEITAVNNDLWIKTHFYSLFSWFAVCEDILWSQRWGHYGLQNSTLWNTCVHLWLNFYYFTVMMLVMRWTTKDWQDEDIMIWGEHYGIVAFRIAIIHLKRKIYFNVNLLQFLSRVFYQYIVSTHNFIYIWIQSEKRSVTFLSSKFSEIF